ncbi:hypothetical protein FRC16_003394 [Serendipita sp. 398]|nr:hypothetical protein FRC16_003394 [Serendipita sp. 398]KAG8823915.1 hypothetical protein FRC18_010639 [Serendipita sp. 400]
MSYQFLLILFFLLFSRSVIGTAPPNRPNHEQLKPQSHAHCHPFGECEPCPEDALNESFCKPFGNRRLVHCLLNQEENERIKHGASHPVIGEIPAWEACGRSVPAETRDFWEFVFCNAALAAISILVLYARSRTVNTERRKALAARIGVQRAW